MIFNSFQFIWLFPLIFISYWLVNKINILGRDKNLPQWVLLIVSYGLYAQWNLSYTLILFGVTLSTFTFARVIEYKKAYGRKKYLIWCGITLTLIPLIVFKYFNFKYMTKI